MSEYQIVAKSKPFVKYTILMMEYDVGAGGFWRQVVVPSTFNLDQLHEVIQAALGKTVEDVLHEPDAHEIYNRVVAKIGKDMNEEAAPKIVERRLCSGLASQDNETVRI